MVKKATNDINFRKIKISRSSLTKLVKKIIDSIKKNNLVQRKMGGLGKVVQVDETMLNFWCKSHRARSPEPRNDALCIVECNLHITNVWVQTIPNKEARTIIPIVCSEVISGSIIHTDEPKSYSSLCRNAYIHNSVCHKYCFADKDTGFIHNTLSLLMMN